MDNQAGSEGSAFAVLWHRAPIWRATILGASVLTLAAAALWAESIPKASPAAQPPGPTIAAPMTSGRPQGHQIGSADAAPLAIPAPQLTENNPSAPNVAANQAAEEEQILAMCHPHLLLAPPSMPQIDAASLPNPNLGHIKVHFWVDGAGTVTREILTEGTLGTPAEQQAEAAYAKELSFSLPNTPECRSREVEVIGDFFEQRDRTGQWATYLRLYPRFSFGNTGALLRRD